jgi:hypothetical protein
MRKTGRRKLAPILASLAAAAASAVGWWPASREKAPAARPPAEDRAPAAAPALVRDPRLAPAMARAVRKRRPKEPHRPELSAALAKLDTRLTPDGARLLKDRLDAWREAERNEARFTARELVALGLSAQQDSVQRAERAGARGISIGIARAMSDDEAAGAPDVDPRLAEGITAGLRARLGREPTAEEVQAGIRANDDEVAALNARLAAGVPARAAAYKARGPRALEADETVVEGEKPEFTPEEGAKLQAALIVTRANAMAAGKAALPQPGDEESRPPMPDQDGQ